MRSDVIISKSTLFIRMDNVEEITLVSPGVSSVVLVLLILVVSLFSVAWVVLTDTQLSKSKYLPS